MLRLCGPPGDSRKFFPPFTHFWLSPLTQWADAPHSTRGHTPSAHSNRQASRAKGNSRALCDQGQALETMQKQTRERMISPANPRHSQTDANPPGQGMTPQRDRAQIYPHSRPSRHADRRKPAGSGGVTSQKLVRRADTAPTARAS